MITAGLRVDGGLHLLAGHVLLKLAEQIVVGFKVIVVVVVKQIGIYLLTDNLVGDYQLGLSSMHSADCHHAEIVQQADEVVVVGDVLGGESVTCMSVNTALNDDSSGEQA